MGEVKLKWIECKLTTCKECKHKCKEYMGFSFKELKKLMENNKGVDESKC